MCRVLFFASLSPARVKELVSALREASRKDPYLEQVSRGRASSHSDGWGYTIYTEHGGRGFYHHYKTVKPIYEDPRGVEKLRRILEEAELAIGIIHARKAGRGQPVSSLDSHPFHANTPGGGELWLAHNGGVDKEAIIRDFGLPEGLAERPDSLVLALGLAKSPGLEEGLRLAAEKYTLSAMNLGILVSGAGGGRPRLVVASYFAYKPETDADRYNYYKLYRADMGDTVVFASSTLVDHLHALEAELPHPGNYHAEVRVEDGELVLKEKPLLGSGGAEG